MGLSNAQRLHFHKEHLTKDPLVVVSKLEISDASYHKAWEILDQYYGDQVLIKNQLLEEISNMRVHPDASALELRRFITKVEDMYRGLVEVDDNLAKEQGTLLPLMEKLFPYQLKKDMISKGGRPTTVKDFLEKAAEIIQLEVQLRGDQKAPKSHQGQPRERQNGGGKDGHGGGGSVAFEEREEADV